MPAGDEAGAVPLTIPITPFALVPNATTPTPRFPPPGTTASEEKPTPKLPGWMKPTLAVVSYPN
jgi:hypothetical protein